MERKIGETFEYEGKTFIVKKDNNYSCHGCVFNKRCALSVKGIAGECEHTYREDNKNVVFVEVREQPLKKTEAIKERKIGEVFEFEGKKLKVVQTEGSTCYNCYFANRDCDCDTRKVLGACLSETRTDNKPVIFVEVKDDQQYEQAEQPQAEQQPQKLDLCEILKYCPAGEPFWSPMLGDVKYYGIDSVNEQVGVTVASGITWDINADGTLTVDDVTSEEVMLYPSREQRDWTNVKYEPKKELPRTWEEFCNQNHITKLEYFIDDSSDDKKAKTEGGIRHKYYDMNVLPSREAAEAHLALMQLHQLRDAWREGWMPDWNGLQGQYIIYNYKGKFTTGIYYNVSRFLSFQDEKRAKEFLECFRYLIEKAGDLI